MAPGDRVADVWCGDTRSDVSASTWRDRRARLFRRGADGCHRATLSACRPIQPPRRTGAVWCAPSVQRDRLSCRSVVKKPDQRDDDDAAAFARAMAAEDVVPLARDRAERVPANAPASLPPLDRSAAARDGHAEPEADADADFAAHGVDRREVRKLKRGDYPAASRCDLHGLTSDAAQETVRQFLQASRHRHHRCVCIVHGRGLRSPGGVAVLKARVRQFLRGNPAVLAYADAPPADGGAGAVYVLLRRA